MFVLEVTFDADSEGGSHPRKALGDLSEVQSAHPRPRLFANPSSTEEPMTEHPAPVEWEELLLKAEAATDQGPWRVSDFEILSGGPDRVLMGSDNYMLAYVNGRSEPEHAAIAEFLAAASPSVIKRLIGERNEAVANRHHFKDEDWPLSLQRLKHMEPGPDQGLAVVGVDDLEFALERLAHFAEVAMGNGVEIGRLVAENNTLEGSLHLANQENAALLTRLQAAETALQSAREAGSALGTEAALLLANSEGCARNHSAETFYANPEMPPWLVDSRRRIEAARAALSPNPSGGRDEGAYSAERAASVASGDLTASETPAEVGMVERVARALHEAEHGSDPDELIHHPAQKSWEEPSWRRWMQHEEAARAAIEAMREPTEAMVRAAPSYGSYHIGRGGTPEYVPSLMGGPVNTYRAMIDAALADTVPQEGG